MRLLHTFAGAAVMAAALVTPSAPAEAQRPGDSAIRQKIVWMSIASYRRNCPCPYSRDRVGHRCGGRSAYSRSGGYAPRCYSSDVTAAEVRAYRAGR